MKPDHRKDQVRTEVFAKRPATRIWDESRTENNPFIASSCRVFGFDLLDLMKKRSFVDVLFLLFRGELPSSEQSELLEQLMISIINPGPRHVATRAAMNAGVGKTDTVHILPISLAIIGGDYLGAGEVEQSMRFFRKQQKKCPEQVFEFFVDEKQRPHEGDWHPVPGFGSRFGCVEVMQQDIADCLSKLPGAGKALEWGCKFSALLASKDMGWLSPGVAAAVFSDLGFHPKTGAGLFQLLNGPGLLAHGLEMANKPMTSMPFLDDERYIIEDE
ncbi:hypothetical protein [Geoalkalibacter halelectricus]|uniref:Citrate synthase n=1 Tax=Geoalkalibacter halelectricus TaxID=2847045 RepID=A0ABY5ZNT9_9BACT|nr:hypothetical protein [Geoalkalibacter halelectricus]MDO3380085.1 hypothetical protein [Geoalkalibacter halelectricus]UWZ80396.1 hypothetical protein L9S41_03075 [Geoalkalibacter halelectricus]